MAKSYFPIAIKIVDTQEILIVNTPQQLPIGRAFVVMTTSQK